MEAAQEDRLTYVTTDRVQVPVLYKHKQVVKD